VIHIVIFNVVQLAVAFYAFRRGGAPERWVGALMLLANIATAFRPYNAATSFGSLDAYLFGIDLLLLLAFAALALTADRFWPMWVAALQLDAVAIHMVRGIDPEMVPYVYAWLTGQIAYPMMAILAIGTTRHQRRLSASGSDPDWTRHERGTSERLAARPS